ncbi:MAG: hypothetical protein ABI211_19495 [Vicinamibacterales bacterium]
MAGVLFMLFSLSVAKDADQPITVEWVGGFGLTGAAVGVLVALCDGPGPGTLLARFLALMSPVTAALPLFGLPFNAAAYFMNRQHPGLYRTISRVTLVAGVIWSLFGLWVVVNYGGQEIK